MIVMIITILIFTTYLILMLYYRYNWKRAPTFEITTRGITAKNDLASGTFVSVIIAARNEEKNISACLESIVAQNYLKVKYEVIVVDDHSTDQTASLVRSFKNNIRLISLEAKGSGIINSYKKRAIETGIAAAKGDLIITTDADCIAPRSWLKNMVYFFEEFNPAFIAAPVAYYGETNFLQIFQSLDFMTMQGITCAAVYKNFHTMCNGANLAYPKQNFYQVGGFSGIDHIASGDDMLLMHKIAAEFPGKIFFLKSQGAIVLTKPAASMSEFFQQRIRWASKAGKYADKRITTVLLLVYLLNLWILLLFIFSCFYHTFLIWLIGLLAGKILVELFFLVPVAIFFGKQKLLWWFPLAQPFHILYIVVAGWLGKFGSYRWKERKVK
ncbi:MAG: glycosyltransferase [Ginsengibacter sp.]